MPKPANTLLILMAICVLTFCQTNERPTDATCTREQCDQNVNQGDLTPLSVSEIVRIVDDNIRKGYWYYLRQAVTLFQTNIDTPQRLLTFFIYRNILGTFLCIADWEKDTRTSNILTFVIIGDGHNADVYAPINIEPFFISLKLVQGEYLIELDADGNFLVNGQIITQIPQGPFDPQNNPFDLNNNGGDGSSDNGDGVTIIVDENINDDNNNQDNGGNNNLNGPNILLPTNENINSKTNCIDNYVRSNYWYYLRDAGLIFTDHITTTQRIYSVLTYINIVGTFLVIGSCDINDKVQVNTFVRLGAGSANIRRLQPIPLQPALFTLQTR